VGDIGFDDFAGWSNPGASFPRPYAWRRAARAQRLRDRAFARIPNAGRDHQGWHRIVVYQPSSRSLIDVGYLFPSFNIWQEGVVAALDPIFVFVHLPRTAGTSMRAVFRQAFTREEIFFVEEFLPVEAERFGGPSSMLANLPRTARDRLRLLAGHQPVALARRIFDRPVHYLTFLRDPIERVVSDYFYCRSEVDNPAHPYAVSLSAGEFAEPGI
jgi:hypothetical protein